MPSGDKRKRAQQQKRSIMSKFEDEESSSKRYHEDAEEDGEQDQDGVMSDEEPPEEGEEEEGCCDGQESCCGGQEGCCGGGEENDPDLPEIPSCEMLEEYLVLDVAALCAGEGKQEDEEDEDEEEKPHGHEHEEYSAKDVLEARLVSMKNSQRFWPAEEDPSSSSSTSGSVSNSTSGSISNSTSPPQQTAHEHQSSSSVNAAPTESALDYLLWPMDPERFFEHHWERRPLLVRRHAPDYYAQVQYTRESGVFEPLRTRPLLHRRHVDVTSYEEGERQTHFEAGRLASESEVRESFAKRGCSVRMLHPQQYHREVWRLLSALEKRWCMGSGANAYLTPAASQGFAPHYDDVDVFVLQLEGSKRWRLYAPPEDELLPRHSSPNFAQEKIGEPFADLTLHAGDMLYLPRGTVHQALCVDEDSLHLTVSTGLRTSWADFFRLALPAAVDLAESEMPALYRRSMPVGWLRYMGVMYADEGERGGVTRESLARERFMDQCGALLQRLVQTMPIDGVADRMAADFIRSRLPPFRVRTAQSASAGSSASAGTGEQEHTKLSADSRVSMVCDQAMRLAVVDSTMLIYSHVHNQRMLHSAADPERGIVLDQEAIHELAYAAGEDAASSSSEINCKLSKKPTPSIVHKGGAANEKEEEAEEQEHEGAEDGAVGELDLEFAPSVEAIIRAYPESVAVGELPLDLSEAITLVDILLDLGLILVVDE